MKESNIPAQRHMSRKQPRSTSGCQRCRTRRKKCDEQKPVCGACQRWGFVCIWPQTDVHTTSGSGLPLSTPDTTRVLVPRTSTGHGFTPFRDQAQLDLLRRFSAVYQGLIFPLAGNDFNDPSPFVVISLQNAWIRDALNVFTGYMISAATSVEKMDESVLSNYQSVVVCLRHKLSHPPREEEDYSALVAMTFLGIFECFGTGQAELAMAHFAAIAILFRSVLARSNPRVVSPLHRIIFEVMLYNLASHSMFSPVPEAALNALGEILRQPVLTQYENTGGPAYRLSPHLGGNFEFQCLIIKVTYFSRQDHSREARAQEVGAWLSQLDYLDRRLRNYYDGAPKMIAQRLKAKYQLYSLALHIYCLKVKDRELRMSSPEVTNLIREATKLYAQGRLDGTHAAAISWPLLVILCACSNNADFNFFAWRVEQMETTFDRGHLRRLEAVMAKLRRRNEGYANSAKEIDLDNFELLLHKQGLSAACC